MTTEKRWIATLSIALAAAAASASSGAFAADNTLRDVMKKLGAAQAGGDAKELAPLLAQAKTLGKVDYPEWNAISDDGIKAAKGGDMAAAKASCKACHDKYKNAYKTKYGSKAP